MSAFPILLTRQPERCAVLAAELAPMGYEVHVQPLQAITALSVGVTDVSSVDGVIITSQNALHGLEGLPRTLPVYAVGQETVGKIREIGFITVAWQPTAEELVEVLKTSKSRSFLYLSGDYISRDFGASLKPYGAAVQRVIAYRADPVSGFSRETLALLASGREVAVMFFSGRPIRIFLDLLARHDLEDAASRMTALVIHPRYRDACRDFAVCHAAAEPSQWGMVALAEKIHAMHHSI
ncbi:MAG: uroporphyrinogen-III synthase [Alphaproteobacteria bacterium]|nr:uroporphyrinogen-III synthase [Alphaproteobacteria bacterium]